MPESHRDLCRRYWISRTSSRDGRFICISIRGDCPMFSELAARADKASVFFEEYAADPSLAIDDERAWHKSNPGLGRYYEPVVHDGHEPAAHWRRPANIRLRFEAYDLNPASIAIS